MGALFLADFGGEGATSTPPPRQRKGVRQHAQ
jgi:hypothetical protein